ncbi:MAG: hypothetical protein ACRDJW_02600, partial [Thermomicrobiales bacterium]
GTATAGDGTGGSGGSGGNGGGAGDAISGDGTGGHGGNANAEAFVGATAYHVVFDFENCVDDIDAGDCGNTIDGDCTGNCPGPDNGGDDNGNGNGNGTGTGTGNGVGTGNGAGNAAEIASVKALPATGAGTMAGQDVGLWFLFGTGLMLAFAGFTVRERAA